MSTRACYQFRDAHTLLVVYKHHDGYPGFPGGHEHIARAGKLAWELPRFEADEFAAAFVAANKTSAGGVRLLNLPTQGDWRSCAPGAIEYLYEIDGTVEGKDPIVTCYAVSERYGEWTVHTKNKLGLKGLIAKLAKVPA